MISRPPRRHGSADEDKNTEVTAVGGISPPMPIAVGKYAVCGYIGRNYAQNA
jgi:hypothetical protein